MSLVTDMGQLIEGFPRIALAELRSPNRLINQITNRDREGEFGMGAERVHEQKIDYSAVVAIEGSDRAAAHADWAASKEYSGDTVTWALDQHSRASVKMRRLDVFQSPVLSVERARQDVSNKIMSAVTSNVVKYMTNLTTHAQGAAADPAANGGAGSIMALPEWGAYTSDTNGAFVDHATGEPVSAGATGSGTNMDIGYRIASGLRSASVVLARARITRNQGENISGGGVGSPFALMAPEIERAFVDWLESKGLGLESVDEPAIREGMVGGDTGSLPDASGTYRGILIVASPDIPKPSAAADGWPVWVGTDRAVSVGELEPVVQVLSPAENQTSPNWETREALDYGRQLVNSGLILRATVNSGG